MSITPWHPTHDCPQRGYSRADRQYQFIVDRVRRTTQEMCSWCSEKFDHPDGEEKFALWSLGYIAGASDASALVMDMPTPERTSWGKA